MGDVIWSGAQHHSRAELHLLSTIPCPGAHAEDPRRDDSLCPNLDQRQHLPPSPARLFPHQMRRPRLLSSQHPRPRGAVRDLLLLGIFDRHRIAVVLTERARDRRPSTPPLLLSPPPTPFPLSIPLSPRRGILDL
jgi:hypothetical protein